MRTFIIFAFGLSFVLTLTHSKTLIQDPEERPDEDEGSEGPGKKRSYLN